ncbi:MAG TPA: carboxypeptidase-like regulatory domain-containing protein, partial [Puia sp.]|nr:carboxypeptidase-like regulatory domain-containing protein [Puia sp.]
MKQLFIIISTLLFSSAVFSQDKTFPVSGQIIDAKTKLPMQNASVFCQNTTIGTITNAEGKFFMRLNNGGYDLVISYTGYETKSMRISNGNSGNDSLVIEMSEKDKSMEQVVVAGSTEVADGWNKYGQFFIDNFIGTTPNASQCMLENKEVLHFYFFKKRNKLKVKSKDDLVVTNNALGYKIRYQL